ncbi:hypothetical protein RvY_10982-2 [Ramazzottius varieornatus]|uniref:Receptor ligand binding region domain-containing protein n=1 Tax=Ramazzottius varieornatus TaxID=947166 RepID=A0A1D1VJ03_RAMVA|nr:hypothetical protein RvY_10982-2 [Ramazzottius varieornatus]
MRLYDMFAVVVLFGLSSRKLLEVSSASVMEASTTVSPVPTLTLVTTAAYQYSEVIPSIAAAVEDVNSLYTGRFSMKSVSYSNQTRFFCEELADDTINLSAAYYYDIRRTEPSGGPIFLSPYCTADFTMMARLTAEWNVPVISTIGSFATDDRKYLTALTIAPAHNTVFGNFLKQFLLYQKWTTLFLLCDDKRNVGFFRANCENFKRLLVAPTFQIPAINFDSGAEAVSYDVYLEFVQKSARVVFLMCRSDVARQFMVLPNSKDTVGCKAAIPQEKRTDNMLLCLLTDPCSEEEYDEQRICLPS